ncbi:hypothetical protein VKT23_004854 [Stygiomarasmius scandens]|uniref:Uncharacterized protein n=1 Tax=Marasmiellus scandens TaxID=2682957 RepID=A0ABR1JTG4_9AGAR
MSFAIRGGNEKAFKAPAHKHAHHLHSIPPREKSVRTLIIDHMLWVHGRTRFAQARAELGMTDRTGGPSSPNYPHRTRPENYEEEDQVSSDGEDAVVLTSRTIWPGEPHSEDPEEVRMASQDLLLAKNLRLRAEGLEKVVTSMLVQPPPVHPIHDEDLGSPPTSPFILPENPNGSVGAAGRRPHQHTLPNGVRLRLALGTVVNDLFSRQAPPPPFRSKRYAAAAAAAAAALPDASVGSTSSLDGAGVPSLLPLALGRIATISAHGIGERRGRHRTRGQGQTQGQTQGITHLLHPDPSRSPSSSISITSPAAQTPSSVASPSAPGPSRPALHPSSSSTSRHPRRKSSSRHSRLRPAITPIPPRTQTLYLAGADPDTANSPPAFRCPRHLHTGCKICVEAKDTPGPFIGGGGSRGRRSTVSRGGSSVGLRAGATGVTTPATAPIGISPDGGGITGYQDGSGIGSGLLRASGAGSVLRRKTAIPYKNEGWGSGRSSNPTDEVDATGSGNTKLSELVPRFLRLSALVAAELGRELREGQARTGPNTSASGSGTATGSQTLGMTTPGLAFSTLPPPASPSFARPQVSRPQSQGQTPNPATPSQLAASPGVNRSPSMSMARPPSQRRTSSQATPVMQNTSQSQTPTISAAIVADTPHRPHHKKKKQLNPFYAQALRPSREWYLLLAGILTRAALQGYLTAGWRGKDAVECLFLVGRGFGLRKGRRRRRRRRTRRKTSEDVEMSTPAGEGEGRREYSGEAEDRNVHGSPYENDYNRDHDEDDQGSDYDDAESSYGSSSDYSSNDDGDSSYDDSDEMGTTTGTATTGLGLGGLVDDDDLFEDFEPDELPSLTEAVRILFPSLRHRYSLDEQEDSLEGQDRGDGDEQGAGFKWNKGKEEEEFEREMDERLKKFYNIPLSTPDLSTHLEDLAWEYPTEPVERAACRFCEAIGKWRGKPELEGYKKKPLQPNSSLYPDVQPTSTNSTSANNNTASGGTPSTPMMTIESLVHSNPTSPTMMHPGVPPASSSTDKGKGKEKESDGDRQGDRETGTEGGDKKKSGGGIELYFLMPENWTGGGINNVGSSPIVSKAVLPQQQQQQAGSTNFAGSGLGATSSTNTSGTSSMPPPPSMMPPALTPTSGYNSYATQQQQPGQIPMQNPNPNAPLPTSASAWGMWAGIDPGNPGTSSRAGMGIGVGEKRTRSPDDPRMGIGAQGGQGQGQSQGQGPSKRFHASMG